MYLSRVTNLVCVFSVLAEIFLLNDLATAKVIGTVGKTYEITEPDFLVELQEHAARVDWDKIIDKKRAKEEILSYQPQDIKKLPAAKENRTFVIDMKYVLDKDIPDGTGGILYPQGFSFNPLDYISLRKTYVFIDATDKKQVEWFRKSKYVNDISTILILSDGSYSDIIKLLKRPVFYLQKPMANRFQLHAVPSVVMQKDKNLLVSEILIPRESGN